MDIALVYHPETMAPALAVGAALLDSMDALVGACPELPASELARAYNHLARGEAYELVEDPDGFEADYRASRAIEDPAGAWSQQRPRLSDFALPDFEQMHPPVLAGELLSFIARDAFTGLAYRVGGPWLTPASARYEPLPSA